MRFHRFSIDNPPKFGAFSAFELERDSISWIQDQNWWQVELVCHDGMYSVDGQTYPFRAGAAIVTPPQSRCRIDRTEEARNYQFWCCFRPQEEGSYPLSFPAVTDLSNELKFWDHQLRIGLDRMPSTKFHTYSIFQAILWRIGLNGAEIQPNHHVMQAEEFIRAHIAEKLNVDDIAQATGLSSSHLSRLFKHELGVTPLEHVRSLRMSLACRFLVGSDMPIKEVAIRVGMGDLQRFNKAVRESFKCSPRKLREQKASPDIYVSLAKDLEQEA